MDREKRGERVSLCLRETRGLLLADKMLRIARALEKNLRLGLDN